MKLDLSRVPWSRRGARLAVSAPPGGGLVLRDVGGGDEIPGEVFDLSLLVDGSPVEAVAEAEPARCAIASAADPSRRAVLEFAAEDRLEIRCEGAGLRLALRGGRYDHVDDLGAGYLEIQCYAKDRKYGIDASGAAARVDAPWGKVGCERVAVDLLSGRATLAEYAVLPAAKGAGADAASSWDAWRASLPPVAPRLEAARELAGYVTWSCVVRPEGRLTRPAMYMSKNWMTNVWSWDNCFNALPLARREPGLALAQLLVFADNQDASGAYPDYVNDKFASRSCLKPPIHAWALERMMARNPDLAGAPELPALYGSIAASTRFWLEGMRLPGGALAYRHGNDSGWDNASIFGAGGPVESPDLYAHLARQCAALASLAGPAGRGGEAAGWEAVASGLVGSMLGRLRDERGFFARRGPAGEPVAARESLILRLPIVAGPLLPEPVAEGLVGELGDEGRFLAPYGLATESLRSGSFRRDGYWLGPVWAPTSYLIIDALREAERTPRFGAGLRARAGRLAREAARRFVEACLAGGMAENFDALTGEGLRDPAFAWTSSVFLLLAEEYPDLS